MVSPQQTIAASSSKMRDEGGGETEGMDQWEELRPAVPSTQHLFTPPPRRRRQRWPRLAALIVIISCAHLISGSSEFSDKDLHLNQNLISPASTSFLDGGSGSHHHHYHPHHSLQQIDDELRFKYATYNVTIPENSVGKTRVQQLTTDLGKLGIKVANGESIVYRIVDGDKDKIFKIEEQKVGDFSFLTLRTRTGNVVLNREKVDEYSLRVKAIATIPPSASNSSSSYHSSNNNNSNRDLRSLKVESQTTIRVKVLDKNDLNPSFYPVEYSVTIPEDLALHKSILQVQADDADLGINGEIYYSFFNKKLLLMQQDSAERTSSSMDSSGVSANSEQVSSASSTFFGSKQMDYGELFSGSLEQFAIHPITGVISLTRPLRFSEGSYHELIVVATDRGGIPTTSTSHHHQHTRNGGGATLLQRINQASKAKVRINVTQVRIIDFKITLFAALLVVVFKYGLFERSDGGEGGGGVEYQKWKTENQGARVCDTLDASQGNLLR